MGKRKAVFMCGLLAVMFGITAMIVAFAEKKGETDGLLCVTSFYPVQLLAEAVSEGAEGVTVKNLTENHSGCIHDYTLTTRDMRLLSEADLFLINGGDMELFLEKAAAEYQDLKIVDTSEGYAFLEGVEHNHDHGADAHETKPCTDPAHHHEADVHEAESCTDPTHDHEEKEADHAEDVEDHAGHSHAVNAHIWLDVDGYLLQLSGVEEAFVQADPAQAALYRKNADACRAELTKLKEEYETAKTALAGKETVVFHEGFVYLLRMLGIETVHCLSMDADTQIAAGEAAEITEECKLHGITLLFAEAEYVETVTDTFAKEISGQVVVLDPVTGDRKLNTGTISDDATGGMSPEENGISLYCTRMRQNLERIMQAYGLR